MRGPHCVSGHLTTLGSWPLEPGGLADLEEAITPNPWLLGGAAPLLLGGRSSLSGGRGEAASLVCSPRGCWLSHNSRAILTARCTAIQRGREAVLR